MASTHPKSAWAPHMPKMYNKKIKCTLYCRVYTVWPKISICHYSHSCDGDGGDGVVVVVVVVGVVVVVW